MRAEPRGQRGAGCRVLRLARVTVGWSPTVYSGMVSFFSCFVSAFNQKRNDERTKPRDDLILYLLCTIRDPNSGLKSEVRGDLPARRRAREFSTPPEARTSRIHRALQPSSARSRSRRRATDTARAAQAHRRRGCAPHAETRVARVCLGQHAAPGAPGSGGSIMRARPGGVTPPPRRRRRRRAPHSSGTRAGTP